MDCYLSNLRGEKIKYELINSHYRRVSYVYQLKHETKIELHLSNIP